MDRPRQALGVATLILVIAGCSSSASPTTDASTPQPAPGGTAAGGGSAGGANGYEGNVVTSGGYAATWTVSPDMEANPFNGLNNPTLTSDKGTFGNIKVMPDGSVSFGSAADGFPGQLTGTGATTTLDATGAFVCSFTVDSDLATADGTKVHLAGTMTVHWHPEGLGDLNCP